MMRFDRGLSAREIRGELGIGEKRLEAIVTEAYKKIAAQLAVGEDGETRWARRQRSLVLACELGEPVDLCRRHPIHGLPAERRRDVKALHRLAALLVAAPSRPSDRLGATRRALTSRTLAGLAGFRHGA
jgi:hypothetical protein